MEKHLGRENDRTMDLILSLQQFFDLVMAFNMVTGIIVVHKNLFHLPLTGERLRYEQWCEISDGSPWGFVDQRKVKQFLSEDSLQEKLDHRAPVDFFQMDMADSTGNTRRCDMWLYYCTSGVALLVGCDIITARRERVLAVVTQRQYDYILYINLRANSCIPYLLNFPEGHNDLFPRNLPYEETMRRIVGQGITPEERKSYISFSGVDRVRAELAVDDEYVVYVSVLNEKRVRDKKLRFIWYDRGEDIVLLTCEDMVKVQNYRQSQKESQIKEQQIKLKEQSKILQYLELMPVAFSVVRVQLDAAGVVSDCIFTYVNKMRAHMDHYRKERMIGCSLLSLFPHLSKIVLELAYQAAYGKKQMQQQVVYDTISQRYISYKVYQYSDGYCMVIMEDVTEQVEKDIALEQSQERMRLILGNTVDTVFQYDLERRCIYANQGNLPGQVRLPDMDNVPASLVEAGYLLASSGILLQQNIDKLVAGESYVSVTLLARIVLTDTFAWHQLAMTTYIEVYTHKRRILGFLKNIHKTVMVQKRLEQEAMRDSLTRLYNRASGIALVKKNLATQSGRHAFFMFDVDDFKVTNDSYGHEYGDMALRMLADVLRKSFRPADVVFRVGGDEFSAFVSPVRKVQDADKICQRILKNIGEAKKQGIGLNVSIGVCLGDSALPYEEYYRKADEALYFIKRQKQGVLDAKYAIVQG